MDKFDKKLIFEAVFTCFLCFLIAFFMCYVGYNIIIVKMHNMTAQEPTAETPMNDSSHQIVAVDSAPHVDFHCDEMDLLSNPVLFANYLHMTENELYLFERYVERCRLRDDCMERRILIAEVIFNRLNADGFPNTIYDMINDSDICDTIFAGGTSDDISPLTVQAILSAYLRINSGLVPTNLLYFNSTGYESEYVAYCECEGLYFMTDGKAKFD